jgi:hypothetical protein
MLVNIHVCCVLQVQQRWEALFSGGSAKHSNEKGRLYLHPVFYAPRSRIGSLFIFGGFPTCCSCRTWYHGVFPASTRFLVVRNQAKSALRFIPSVLGPRPGGRSSHPLLLAKTHFVCVLGAAFFCVFVSLSIALVRAKTST